MLVDYRTLQIRISARHIFFPSDFVNVVSTRYTQSLRSFRHIPSSFFILALALLRFFPCLPFLIPLRIDLARERTAYPLALVSYANP